MEHERKTFPLKPTVIAPASLSLTDEINTCSEDTSRVGEGSAAPCVSEAARYEAMLPPNKTVISRYSRCVARFVIKVL